MKWSSCRVRGQKRKLSYRQAESGAANVNKKKNQQLGMLRPAHCSLYLLWSQERKEKKSVFFFPFHCNKFPVILFPPLSMEKAK